MNDYSKLTNPELNRAIAERMGWTQLGENRYLTVRHGLKPEGYRGIVPDFAGDMNAAITLVKDARYFTFNKVGETRFEGTMNGIDGDPSDVPSRAVCLAWLSWSDATDAREAGKGDAAGAGEGK